MLKSQNRCLILFVREPLRGKVKTRLEPALGVEGTLNLYRKMVKRNINLVNGFSNSDLQLWVDGNSEHTDFQQFSGSFHQQEGADIGERMLTAMQLPLSSFTSTVLIGCDCPDISDRYLEKAFKALEQGADAVFGPAFDGGYVLVGLRAPLQDIFENIEWGSAKVMAQTRLSLRARGQKWVELDSLHDIDEPDDLKYLSAELSAMVNT